MQPQPQGVTLGRAIRRWFNYGKRPQGEEQEGLRVGRWTHTLILRNLPIEKGRKASLFLNCPFSRKCSGLNVSGVAHSVGSLCSAVRLVRIMVP